jgi:hypothetical protein
MGKYHSDLEELWLRRATVEACMEVLHEYEELRRDAKHVADNNSDYYCGEYGEVTDEGELILSEDDYRRAYERWWSSHISEEDQKFAGRGGGECGSIKQILSRADVLVEAILGASESGCESKLYGIHRIKVD